MFLDSGRARPAECAEHGCALVSRLLGERRRIFIHDFFTNLSSLFLSFSPPTHPPFAFPLRHHSRTPRARIDTSAPTHNTPSLIPRYPRRHILTHRDTNDHVVLRQKPIVSSVGKSRLEYCSHGVQALELIYTANNVAMPLRQMPLPRRYQLGRLPLAGGDDCRSRGRRARRPARPRNPLHSTAA